MIELNWFIIYIQSKWQFIIYPFTYQYFSIIYSQPTIIIMILQPIPKQHYLHYQQFPHSARAHIKSFTFYDTVQHHHRLAIINHNAIQIHEIKGNSIVYIQTHQLMSDITIIQVIKNKGNYSDWLFLGDNLGRYMFWDPNQGAIEVNNSIKKNDFTSQYFPKSEGQEKLQQFSGINTRHNVHDTQVCLFFTVEQKVIFLDFVIKKGKMIHRQQPIITELPYEDIIYVGIIDSKQNLLGVVQNQEEKTFLSVHRIAEGSFNCIYNLEKTCLRSFLSNQDQLTTITTSEISLYRQKQHNATFQLNSTSLCNFQISEQGSICVIDNKKYLFVSEVCEQLIIFSHKHYKNYGSFVMDNDICVAIQSHGILPDNGYLISIIDQGYAVEFIAVYEDHWKSIKSIQGISPIFSIEDIPGVIPQNLVVTRISDNFHQIGILSNKLPSKLKKESQVNGQVLQIFSLNNGKAILLSTSQDNIVFIYDDSKGVFQLGFELLPGDIILATDKYLVSSTIIYELDLNLNKITQKLEEKQNIVSADFSGKYIGYQTQKLKYKFYNVETCEIDRVRVKTCEEYIWKFHLPELLLVGSFQYPDLIQALPVFHPIQTNILLNTHQTITDICSMGQVFAVSFIAPIIEVYSLSSKNLIYSLNTSSHSFNIISFNSLFMFYSTFQSYLLSIDPKTGAFSTQGIQFDNQKDCISCVYLKASNSVLVGHQNSIALYEEPCLKNMNNITNFRVIGVSMQDQSGLSFQLPFVTYYKESVYIITQYEVTMRNIQTAQMIKKQSHSLKDIQCIEKLEDKGILVCGLDDMQNAQLLVIRFTDLEIIIAELLGKKVPTAIKCTDKPNEFFIRSEQYISLYEITENQKVKLRFSSKTKLLGYTLAVNPGNNMLIVSDPLRYVVAYDYSLGKLVHLARYLNTNTLNDIGFIDNSAVFSDCIGNLKALQFNLEEQQVARSQMSEVGNLKVSTDISYLGKGKLNTLVYSGFTGNIGRIIGISGEQFEYLKSAQKYMEQQMEKQKLTFDYKIWRRRTSLDDKFIDDFLIKKYMLDSKVGVSVRQEVQQIWKRVRNIFG